MMLALREVKEPDVKAPAVACAERPLNGYAAAAFSNLVIAAIGLASGPLLARVLGPEGRGTLAAMQTAPMLVASLSLLGIPTATSYCVSQHPMRARDIVRDALAVSEMGAAVGAVVSYFLMPIVLRRYPPHVISAAQAYAIIGFFLAASQVAVGVLQGSRRLRAWNAARIAIAALWLLSGAIAALTARRSALTVARVYVIMYGVTAPLIWWLAWRGSPRSGERPRSWSGELLRFGVPTALGVVPATLNSRLDQLLVSVYLPPGSVGLYVVAAAWANASTPLLNALGSIVMPRLAAEPSPDARARLVRHALCRALLLASIVGLGLLAATPIAVPLLFGASFVGSVRLSLVLVVALLLANVNSVMEESLRGCGRPRVLVVTQYACIPLTLGLQWALVHRWGAMGCAVASLIAYSGVSVTLWHVLAATVSVAPSDLLPRVGELRSAALEVWADCLDLVWRVLSPSHG